MAYQVDRFNGTFLTSVEDGTIDNTTDIRFVGKNYAGYGEVQNENFLHMLEHFANVTAPPKAVTGQIWYDSGNKRLKFYDGSRWKTVNGSETGTTSPAGLDVGEFWWDTAAKQLYVWSGTEFVLIGPEASPDLGASSIEAEVVRDTGEIPHTILKMFAAGKVVATVSSDPDFTLSTDDRFADFTVIKQGITLAATNSNGASTNYIYWGTASNALSLGGFSASDYLKAGNQTFTSVHFTDNGYTLGTETSNTADFRLHMVNDDTTFDSISGTPLQFRIYVNNAFSTISSITQDGIIPGTTAAYDLGSASLKWNNIHAVTVNADLIGNVTGNTTGTHTGDLKSNSGTTLIDAAAGVIGYTGADIQGVLTGTVIGDVTGKSTNADTLTGIAPSTGLPTDPITGLVLADKTSIPVRNNAGNITANQFIGTADSADKLKLGLFYASSSTNKDSDTIAARDSVGDLYANFFRGTATAAQYADLAEKYLCDKEYGVGTVVSVCEHDTHEVEACSIGDRALGVVSENPAFMMNSELEGGTYIALKGRVPVKVKGPVKKGQRLVAGENGCAIAFLTSSADVFAIALESSNDPGEKTIEAVIL